VPDDVLSKGDMYDVLSNEGTDIMNVPESTKQGVGGLAGIR